MTTSKQLQHIVIIGGGAGGLELATLLGNTLGKKQKASVTLVDMNLIHVWKPLWHEVAAGTLTSGENEINYIVHAYNHHFKFQLGKLKGLDRQKKEITLAATEDNEEKNFLPERKLSYDLLIFAIGSISHDFQVPGVREHCYFLDSYADCQQFQQQLLKNLIRLQEQIQPKLDIAIIGGGATGVELAAELEFAGQQAFQYKRKNNNNHQSLHLQISIIENSPRILPALPEKISTITREELQRRKIKVYENERVVKVDEKAVYTQNGLEIPATLKVWAAGIKAAPILATLGLEVNDRNQLIVKPTLQTVTDESIFAFGDCAFCMQADSDHPVPPRAQAAHQQAKLLAKSLNRYLQGKSLLPYHYLDHGSLVTLSQYNTLGSLMGRALGNVMLEGKLARFAYRFLYREHQAALYGWWSVTLFILADRLTRSVRPRLKLH